MPIRDYEAPPSPVDAINKALGLAASYYGIKKAVRESDQADQMNDPNSAYSKTRKNAMGLALDYAVKRGAATPEQISPLKDSIEQSSGAELDKMTETNPFFKLIGQEMAAQASQLRLSPLIEGRKEMQENTIHAANVKKLQNDSNLKQRLVQYQNLDNAFNNFANADHTTPQQVDELQQAIRSNLGIKGAGGVDERSHTYINTLGLNAKRLEQMITGNPQDVAQNDALVGHLKQLVKLEQGNINGQFQNRVKALTAGHDSLYRKRPELKEDLMNAAKDVTSQIAEPPAPPQMAAPNEAMAAPTGGPKPGTIEDGHQFIGGDPGNPQNWKKVP